MKVENKACLLASYTTSMEVEDLEDKRHSSKEKNQQRKNSCLGFQLVQGLGRRELEGFFLRGKSLLFVYQTEHRMHKTWFKSWIAYQNLAPLKNHHISAIQLFSCVKLKGYARMFSDPPPRICYLWFVQTVQLTYVMTQAEGYVEIIPSTSSLYILLFQELEDLLRASEYSPGDKK